MVAVPCLAYLLDTPVRAGEVVEYRCTRPAGHTTWTSSGGQLHEDATTPPGIVWEDETCGVVFADGARVSAVAWADQDDAGPDPRPAVPPLPATPTPIDVLPDFAHPWAQLRDDARTLHHTS